MFKRKIISQKISFTSIAFISQYSHFSYKYHIQITNKIYKNIQQKMSKIKAIKINGLQLAEQIITQLQIRIGRYQSIQNIFQDTPGPRLGIIMVGDNPMSLSFIKRKRKYARLAQIKTRLFTIKADDQISPEQMLKNVKNTITKLNNDAKYHGILLQLPINPKISKHQSQLLDMIDQNKDVDCLSKANRQIYKTQLKNSTIKPCVVGAVLKIFEKYQIVKPDSRILIIGKGKLAGLPLYQLLSKQSQNVNIIDNTINKGQFQKLTQSSDIILSATGVPINIQKTNLKKDCTILDIGCSPDPKNPGKVRGDFEQKLKQEICKYYTPVPKGIGPLVVTSLMQNVYQTWRKQVQMNYEKNKHVQ